MSNPEPLGREGDALPITAHAASEPDRHGGDLDWARRRFPNAPTPWIDLSTGVNPIAYPLPALEAASWTRLPDRVEEARLLAAAAARYGASEPACLVAAPGTQALIQLLPRLFARARVAVLGPTYTEHETCWRRAGHEVVLSEPTADVLARGPRVVVVTNPNNPTGRLVTRAELNDWAHRLAARGGALIVDEAFIDVLPSPASLVPDLPPATIVLRSFGKTYGLAGLRLGFAVAAPPLIARLRAELGPWAVSGPALRIGTVALADAAWLTAARQRLKADQERLDRLLAAAGCAVCGGTPLFRLVEHPRAALIAERLDRQGIHVRRFARKSTWLRLGLPGEVPDWVRLERALCA
jgi:cobalamin biosynthetic protein CobC